MPSGHYWLCSQVRNPPVAQNTGVFGEEVFNEEVMLKGSKMVQWVRMLALYLTT